jgi:hypothetical protein
VIVIDKPVAHAFACTGIASPANRTATILLYNQPRKLQLSQAVSVKIEFTITCLNIQMVFTPLTSSSISFVTMLLAVAPMRLDVLFVITLRHVIQPGCLLV